MHSSLLVLVAAVFAQAPDGAPPPATLPGAAPASDPLLRALALPLAAQELRASGGRCGGREAPRPRRA
jgi:hypothetical protein